MTALLSTTYFGPVQWYQKLYRYDDVLVERFETFPKQTYRNRCIIAATDGPLALTVPVVRDSLPAAAAGAPPVRLLTKDVRISDHGDWRRQHWNALVSAYGDSPFFDYYQDDLRPFFEQRYEYLLDFNEAIRRVVCQLIDIEPAVGFTTGYTPADEFSADKDSAADASYSIGSTVDFREAIRPKHPAADAGFQPRRYYQVYERKHGFLPNLSILDLLFNMGPESIFYL